MIYQSLRDDLILGASPVRSNHSFCKDAAACTKSINPDDIFQSLKSVGIHHGPSFRNIISIYAGQEKSLSTFTVADTASLMPAHYEISHILHPTTLDSIFQAMYSVYPKAAQTSRTQWCRSRSRLCSYRPRSAANPATASKPTRNFRCFVRKALEHLLWRWMIVGVKVCLLSRSLIHTSNLSAACSTKTTT